MIRVDLKTLECSLTPVPNFLHGLGVQELRSLTWTDASLGVQNFGWWPVQQTPVNFDPQVEQVSATHYTADLATFTVIATSVTEPIPNSVLTERLQLRRTEMLGRVNNRCQEILQRLKTGYPEGEVLSWDQQVAEARALTIDPSDAAPLLRAVAQARGIPVDALAVKVLEKTNLYAMASGAVIGNRQKLETLLTNATTSIELEAIDTQSGWLNFS